MAVLKNSNSDLLFSVSLDLLKSNPELITSPELEEWVPLSFEMTANSLLILDLKYGRNSKIEVSVRSLSRLIKALEEFINDASKESGNILRKSYYSGDLDFEIHLTRSYDSDDNAENPDILNEFKIWFDHTQIINSPAPGNYQAGFKFFFEIEDLMDFSEQLIKEANTLQGIFPELTAKSLI